MFLFLFYVVCAPNTDIFPQTKVRSCSYRPKRLQYFMFKGKPANVNIAWWLVKTKTRTIMCVLQIETNRRFTGNYQINLSADLSNYLSLAISKS